MAVTDQTTEQVPASTDGVDQRSAVAGSRATVEASAVAPLVQVAVPSPLHRLFDYRWLADSETGHPIVPGQRVTVPFGRRSVVGIVVARIEQSDVPPQKLRRISALHEAEPLLPADLVKLLLWSSRYYHHAVGDVLSSALPVALRKGSASKLSHIEVYRVGSDCPEDFLNSRAPLQNELLKAIRSAGSAGLTGTHLVGVSRSWRTSLAPLIKKGWVERLEIENLPVNEAAEKGLELLPEQQRAVDAVNASDGEFKAFLLNGVTGSGKTEVYLQLIQRICNEGRQALVLVPEISLTPQLLQRFQRRISGCIVSLHSAMNDNERMQNWLLAAFGKADVVIGTRSAIFTPLPRLGLIVIDEEHDASLKQQDGFRYHARDLALMRARERSVPILLGTATPSFETLRNVSTGRYEELRLMRRAGEAKPPSIALLDIRRRRLIEGLSDRLLDQIKQHLENDGQVLIFLNRRGYAPTLLCNDCGACTDCTRCDAHMTVHSKTGTVRCHHCGAERGLPSECADCGSGNLDMLGQGTERIEAALQEQFPDVHIARIDRDSTRRKGALQQHLSDATSGKARILVGTQMLAKGHHFPGVTLVGILDADRGLFGTDFRALEQMGQLIVQVAGRAGREKRQGSVLVQTRNPDNPLMQTLVSDGYEAFATSALQDRKNAELPPYTFVALVRAEAASQQTPREFLTQVGHVLRMHQRTLPGFSKSSQAPADSGAEKLEYFGPVAAPMERLGGRYRAQLMVQSDSRATLNRALATVVAQFEQSPVARKVRWSIDVDPVDML